MLKWVSGMASLSHHFFVPHRALFLKREFFIPSEKKTCWISSPFCQLSLRERIIASLTKEGPSLTIFPLSVGLSDIKTQFETVVYVLAVIVLLSTSVLQILALCVIAAWMCLCCGRGALGALDFLAFPSWAHLPGHFPSSPPSLVIHCPVSNDWSVQHWCRCCTLAVKFYVSVLLENIYPAFKQLIFEGRREGIDSHASETCFPRGPVKKLLRFARCKATSTTAWEQGKEQRCSGKCCHSNLYKGIQSCREQSLALIKLK